jgi:hypothetical protein
MAERRFERARRRRRDDDATGRAPTRLEAEDVSSSDGADRGRECARASARAGDGRWAMGDAASRRRERESRRRLDATFDDADDRRWRTW